MRSSLEPLESLRDLPTVYHGSRDPEALFRDGYDAGPALDMAHFPEYAWTGCRRGSFCEGGGVNWKPLVWSWWKDLPLTARRRFAQETGGPIKAADDLGERVQLLFTTKSRREAEAYARTDWDEKGRMLKQWEPLALDASAIPGVLGYFQPDVNDKGETVLVLRLGSSDLSKALVRDNPDGPPLIQAPINRVQKWLYSTDGKYSTDYGSSAIADKVVAKLRVQWPTYDWSSLWVMRRCVVIVAVPKATNPCGRKRARRGV